LDVSVATTSTVVVGWALSLYDAWGGIGGNASVGDTKSTGSVGVGSLQNLWVFFKIIEGVGWVTTVATVVTVSLRTGDQLLLRVDNWCGFVLN
jgi:hypothetical protein